MIKYSHPTNEAHMKLACCHEMETTIIQIKGKDRFPVTYYLNDSNIDDISSKLNTGDRLKHGFIYYLIDGHGAIYYEPMNSAHRMSLNIPININLASENEFAALPGIGEKTASSIIKYRNYNGDFRNISELRNIYGIGRKKLSRIKRHITVD